MAEKTRAKTPDGTADIAPSLMDLGLASTSFK
jgi:hypothetical protein